MDMMLLLKASVLLTAALAAARLLRHAPAATRHGLWSVAFAALLALPVLAFIVPALPVPVPSGWSAFAAASVHRGTPATPSASEAQLTLRPTPAPLVGPGLSRAVSQFVGHGFSRADADVPTVTADAANRTSWPSPRNVLAAAWLAGTIAAVIALGVSLLRVRRLASESEALSDPAWRAAADAIGARLGLRRPAQLLVSARVATPMAGGVWRSVIFLPESASSWSAERRDIVLAHELVHTAGRDPLRHLAARMAVALYWFPSARVARGTAGLARARAGVRRRGAGARYPTLGLRPHPARFRGDAACVAHAARRHADGGAIAPGETTHGHPD